MYGPPPDPAELPIDLAAHPGLILVCVLLGLGITGLVAQRKLPVWGRAIAFMVGQVVMLTAPLTLTLGRWVYGSWPTIDKTGSLQFYLDGAHTRLYAHPLESLSDPAVRLIGVHIGHHWLTAVFDLVLPPFGALNASGLFYVLLAWGGCALFAWELQDPDRTRDRRMWVALLAGAPFGLGLHVFRDLNWYTIEKVAVGLLALFAWACLRASRERRWVALPALIFAVTALTNLYLAMVAGVGLFSVWAVTVAGERSLSRPVLHLAVAGVLCLAAAMPIAAYQAVLLDGLCGQLADPEAYLHQRAALDNFSLWPLAWNRLEVWRALNLPLIAAAVWGAVRSPVARALVVAALPLFGLALGPFLFEGVENPVYMGLRAVAPGFWRVATPEVFFEGSYVLLLGASAVGLNLALDRVQALSRRPWLLWGVAALGWLLLVRTHPAFPGFTEFVDVPLDADWASRVQVDCAP